MATKAALVATLLWCIIQVTHVPCVLGSTILVQVSMKRSNIEGTDTIPSQGQEECVDESPFLQQVNLTAPAHDGLVAQWALVQTPCKDISAYEVSFSEVGGAVTTKYTTQNTYFRFPGLWISTAYQVQVQPLDDSGQAYGEAVTAEQTTLDGTSAGNCPFPQFTQYIDYGAVGCIALEKPIPSTWSEALAACQQRHPSRIGGYTSTIYYDFPWAVKSIEDFLEHLRALVYTEEILVSAVCSQGSWMWQPFAGTVYPMDSALLTGVPDCGDGPDDFKMLYLDPKKDFGFSAAKDGHEFGALACQYAIPVYH